MIKEIQLLRPLLIIGVIIGHCFCIFNEGNSSWPNTIGVDQIYFYSYLNPFFISLGTFVMIMGYLFAYKKDKYLKEGNIKFIYTKFIRLYIPCIFFSIIYAFLFIWKDASSISIPMILKVIVYGAGHMWFLPMTFAVYTLLKIVQPIVDRHPLSSFLCCICLVPFASIVPDQVLLYFPFIILGYIIYGHTQILEIYAFHLLFLWLIVFVARCYAMDYITISKVSIIMRFLSNLTSALAFWGLSMKAVKQFNERTSKFVSVLSKCAFGAYLLQEFIIRFIIYHTSIFFYCNSIIYPWIIAFIAVPVSFGISYIGNRTKIGNVLLS